MFAVVTKAQKEVIDKYGSPQEGMKNKNLKYLMLLTLFNCIMITRNLFWFVDMYFLFVIRLASLFLSKKSERKTSLINSRTVI